MSIRRALILLAVWVGCTVGALSAQCPEGEFKTKSAEGCTCPVGQKLLTAEEVSECFPVVNAPNQTFEDDRRLLRTSYGKVHTVNQTFEGKGRLLGTRFSSGQNRDWTCFGYGSSRWCVIIGFRDRFYVDGPGSTWHSFDLRSVVGHIGGSNKLVSQHLGSDGTVWFGLSNVGHHRDAYYVVAFRRCGSNYCVAGEGAGKLHHGCGFHGLNIGYWKYQTSWSKVMGKLEFGLSGKPPCAIYACRYGSSISFRNYRCIYSPLG